MQALLKNTKENLELLKNYNILKNKRSLENGEYIVVTGKRYRLVPESEIINRGWQKNILSNPEPVLKKIETFNTAIEHYLQDNIDIDIRLTPINRGRERLAVVVKIGEMTVAKEVKIIVTNGLGQRTTS